MVHLLARDIIMKTLLFARVLYSAPSLLLSSLLFTVIFLMYYYWIIFILLLVLLLRDRKESGRKCIEVKDVVV